MSKYDELEKLNQLKEEGAISEEEYQREKERILAEPPPYSAASAAAPPGPWQPWGMAVPTYCMVLHLSQLISVFLPPGGWVMPVVMWAIFKDRDPRIDRHGKVVINWILSALVYTVICALLAFIVIGIPMLIALHVTGLVFAVIGGIKANDGQVWPYPMSISFFQVPEEPGE